MIGVGDKPRVILCLRGAVLFRSLATGMIGVTLGFYLPLMGLTNEQFGWVISLGLAGGALSALIVTLFANRGDRKWWLLVLSLLYLVFGVLFIFAGEPRWIALWSLLGMMNGMSRDRGAHLLLEQLVLARALSEKERTGHIAVYNLIQDWGQAIGGLLAGIPGLLKTFAGVTPLMGHQGMLAIYLFFHFLSMCFYFFLPSLREPPEAVRVGPSPESRRIVFRISALFFLDSLGGGFITTALLSYFFFHRFGASAEAIALLIFCARVANGMSHLGAAWIASKIGLVNTMVFTHIPSSLLLVTVGFAPNFPVAAALFLLRESLVEMDVPTRQSYVLGVVKPAERVFASGVTHLVRMAGWAVAPAFAGLLLRGEGFWPLVCAAGLKITYDILLYISFINIKPVEEKVP